MSRYAQVRPSATLLSANFGDRCSLARPNRQIKRTLLANPRRTAPVKSVITTVCADVCLVDRTMSEPVEDGDGRMNLNARIESRTLQPNLCTIYSPDSEDDVVMERWITAREGFYIDAVLMR